MLESSFGMTLRDSTNPYQRICHYPMLRLSFTKTVFFALRSEVEDSLDQQESPKLLIYVPMDPAQTQHDLIELESTGVTLKPGAVPPTCNTRPAYIARQALQSIIGEDAVQAIEKQVEEGKLSLADLEKLAEKGIRINGVVSLIFDSGSPQEVALAFLASDQHDIDLSAKEAMPELTALLQTIYELQPIAGTKPADYRKALARFVLVSDLLYRMPAPLPVSLDSVAAAAKPAAREACAGLTSRWIMFSLWAYSRARATGSNKCTASA